MSIEVVIRRGSLTRTKYHGFNFSSISGSSTYSDPIELCENDDENVNFYELEKSEIINLSDENDNLKKQFFKKIDELEILTNDTDILSIIKIAKQRIKEIEKNGGIYSYLDVEEYGIDFLANLLNCKGLLLWENDDITSPSTYLVFDLSIVKKIDKKKICEKILKEFYGE